jgi:hypothetical protein
MGSKKKQLDDLDTLRNRVKEQEQTIKVLRRRLKKLEQFHMQKNDLELEAEIKEEMADLKDENKPDEIPVCPECKGSLAIVKVANRVFSKCSNQPFCKWRSKSVIEED